ncbi:molybdopterin molybdotransferase MoeA [Naasia sp. SYSU D00948]|uniref:molybdopterin molybdotransferase MoeA n=1 Tax=Naasia sp. SYSU D00948 TaxID=2817379 RepID=UPI001B317AD6|nr:molybdopterin molybdotransferase MoeA [Naasia sp. SYSU D00948]
MTVAWAEARAIARTVGSDALTGYEHVPVAEGAGRVLAAPLAALCDLPGADTSAMDGWAVSGPGPWLLEAEIAVGDPPPSSPLPSGVARPIATGAPVPPGGVAILRRERGEERDGVLRVVLDARAPLPGADIRRRGEEVTAGEPVLDAGRVLTPPAVALAAASGLDELPVRIPPLADVLVLGREVEPAGVPSPGRVRDALGPQLPAVLAGLGARSAAPVLAGDDREAVLAALEAAGGDLLVTTGGTADGPTDVLRSALAGCRLVVDRVAMRPGAPALLAVRPDGRPVLALPGNPFAALVALLTLGAPLLDGMLGRPSPPLLGAPAAEDIGNERPGVRVVACRRTGEGVSPVAFQGAGTVRGAAEADVLAVVPEGGVRAGESVPMLPPAW